MVDNTPIKNKIAAAKQKLTNISNPSTLSDWQGIAIFSILDTYVELECFIINSYTNYAIGESSVSGYKPTLKIAFPDKESVEKFHKKINGFVKIDVIEYLYKDVFDNENNKNPFSNLFETQLKSDFSILESIRNIICHKSDSSEKAFFNKCNNGRQINLEDYLFHSNTHPLKKTFELLTSIEIISESIVTPI